MNTDKYIELYNYWLNLDFIKIRNAGITHQLVISITRYIYYGLCGQSNYKILI